jgi:hypothetical protein
MVAMIPQTDLFLVLIPCLMVIGGLAFYILSLRATAKEVFIFRKAKAKNLDIGINFDIATGRGDFELLKPADGDSQSPTLESSGPGVHMRADFCTGRINPVIINRQRLFFYAKSSSHPLGGNQIAALNTMVKHRFDKEKWRKLDFLPSRDLFSLMRTPEDDLPAACNLFIQEHNPQALGDGCYNYEDLTDDDNAEDKYGQN